MQSFMQRITKTARRKLNNDKVLSKALLLKESSLKCNEREKFLVGIVKVLLVICNKIL
jgi:hypothetical protein